MTLQATRDLLTDERLWCIAAVVALHEGETSRFDISEEGHLIVSVLTLQHSIPIWAILCGGDNDRHGIWHIPSLGTEVMLCFSDGEFEGDAYIVSLHGKGPTNLVDDKVYVLGDEVQVRTPGGTAVSLAKQSSVDAIQQKLDSFIAEYIAHVHTSAAPGSPTSPTVSTLTPVGATQGTDVLKGQ